MVLKLTAYDNISNNFTQVNHTKCMVSKSWVMLLIYLNLSLMRLRKTIMNTNEFIPVSPPMKRR